MSESDFQSHVLKLARQFDWRAYHTFNSRRSQPGFPDLVLVRGDRLIFAELKTEKGRVSPAQKEWLEALDEAHVEVYIWRPRNLPQVEQVLAA